MLVFVYGGCAGGGMISMIMPFGQTLADILYISDNVVSLIRSRYFIGQKRGKSKTRCPLMLSWMGRFSFFQEYLIIYSSEAECYQNWLKYISISLRE